PPTVLSTLSLHDALPICSGSRSQLTQGRASLAITRRTTASETPLLDGRVHCGVRCDDAQSVVIRDAARAASLCPRNRNWPPLVQDRKSTRLNSSHSQISY